MKRIDPTGLVEVTLGSEVGLAKGQTLEVFRLSPGARYLGSIQIVSVSHKEAVGQVMGRMAAPVREGDVVAGRIVR